MHRRSDAAVNAYHGPVQQTEGKRSGGYWYSEAPFWGCLLAVLADAVPEAVTQAVADLVPGLTPDSIAPTPVPGLYLVAFGAQVVYLSADGRYLLAGDLIELESGQNLADDVRSVIRKKDHRRTRRIRDGGLFAGQGPRASLRYLPMFPVRTACGFTSRWTT